MQFLVHNGIKLAYNTRGAGAPPIVLVHGWGDSHATLSTLTEHFAVGHQVVAVDLRGHGASDKPEGAYTIATFADDLTWLCMQLALKQPVIVGHSLGGAIALELAARYPDLPAAVVALEGTILFPAEVREGSKSLVDALHTPEWRMAMHAFVDMNFTPTDDEALRQQTHAEIEHVPQHVHVSIAEEALQWDAAEAARNCRVPVLYIEGGSGLSDLDQFKRLYPQLVVGRTVGLGHYQMVATPAQATAMIDRFLAISLRV